MKKWHKSLLIGLGALIISTVAIQASDVVRGINGSLSGLVIESTSVCGSGAVQLNLGSHALCVDIYEASAGDTCPHTNPDNQILTQENANDTECMPVSKSNVMPWRFVSLTQAQQLCARVGKRLPKNDEWYKIASGLTDIKKCVIDTKKSEPSLTGTQNCVTPSGIYDVVGNVWEWIDEQVHDGTYDNRSLPPSGFVSLVDNNGVVITTDIKAVADFGEDYEFSNFTETYSYRFILNQLNLKVNSDSIHRIEKLISYYDDYMRDYLPYFEEKPSLTRSQLQVASAEDYDALINEVPTKQMQFHIKNLSLEFYAWDHKNSKIKKKISLESKSSEHKKVNLYYQNVTQPQNL